MTAWLARRGVRVLLGLAVVACIVAFKWPASPAASSHFLQAAGALPFDERAGTGYTAADVAAAMHALGEAGRAHYLAYRLVDLAFPWLFAGLATSLLASLGAAAAAPATVLAAVLDTLENALLFAVLAQGELPGGGLVSLASAVTQLKFAAYALVLLILVGAGIRHALHRRDLAPAKRRTP